MCAYENRHLQHVQVGGERRGEPDDGGDVSDSPLENNNAGELGTLRHRYSNGTRCQY